MRAVIAGGLMAARASRSHTDDEPPQATTPRTARRFLVTHLRGWELQALKPKLRRLWEERRLVLGSQEDPWAGRMDFAEALVELARASPLLVPEQCGGRSPACGVLMSSGLRPAATAAELRAALEQTFGHDFLRVHEFNPGWDGAEQRRHVRELLHAMKTNFHFYRQGCLAEGNSGRSCESAKPSEYIGRIACSPDEDDVTDDCVYAELRRCTEACGDGSGFFEYARMHGPIGLLKTVQRRDRFMGQCEEFSRTGYALLSSLGYEARYVLDFTDHVWLEVKMLPKGGVAPAPQTTQWVHVDPSEGIVDEPLMYERGWGKELTMIFAFTPWSVEHVTATYTETYNVTVARRGLDDTQLQSMLEEVNDRLAHELARMPWGYGAAAAMAAPTGSRAKTFEGLELWSHFEA